MNIINSFSIDLEDWYQGNEKIKLSDFHLYENRIEYSTDLILDLFEKYNIKSTFFVLGDIAKNNPNLIKKVHSKGHEIASHGYSHEIVYLQTPSQFQQELRDSKNILEDIIGERIIGHRASNWSITEKSLWALDILKEEGFLYDSSIYPTKNYLFGIPDAPRFAHRLENGLWEVPPSTIKYFNKTLPFAGGFFLRALHRYIINFGIRKFNENNQPAIMYLHPWELDLGQPKRLPVPLKNNIIHYWGLATTENKLNYIFSKHQFGRLDSIYKTEIFK